MQLRWYGRSAVSDYWQDTKTQIKYGFLHSDGTCSKVIPLGSGKYKTEFPKDAELTEIKDAVALAPKSSGVLVSV